MTMAKKNPRAPKIPKLLWDWEWPVMGSHVASNRHWSAWAELWSTGGMVHLFPTHDGWKVYWETTERYGRREEGEGYVSIGRVKTVPEGKKMAAKWYKGAMTPRSNPRKSGAKMPHMTVTDWEVLEASNSLKSVASTLSGSDGRVEVTAGHARAALNHLDSIEAKLKGVPGAGAKRQRDKVKFYRAEAKKLLKGGKGSMKKENPYSARGKPIGIVGDVSPIEHWGGIVFQRPGKQYSMLYFQSYDGDKVSVFDFEIEDDVVKDLGWVNWDAVASSIGMPVEELKGYGRSKNVMARASVYEAVGGYDGFGNLDGYQQEMTIRTAEGKWDRSVNAALRAQSKARSKAMRNVQSNPVAQRRAAVARFSRLPRSQWATRKAR